MPNKANTRWFQQQLKSLGAKIDVTGVNDDQSRKAISDFQKSMGVEITGDETLDTVHALHDYKMNKLQGSTSAGAGSGASASGTVQPAAPQVAAGNPSETEPARPAVAAGNPSETEPAVGTTLPADKGPDFTETKPQAPLPIKPATVRPGDPTFAAMSPDMQKTITDENFHATVDAHNQNVGLTRSLAAHVDKMQGAAIDPNNVAGSNAPPFVLDLRSVAGQ
jgi:peptidoglycan hydrolase-like protein with peptidoglycan-binding domain